MQENKKVQFPEIRSIYKNQTLHAVLDVYVRQKKKGNENVGARLTW